MHGTNYDVVIIGGGLAGGSCAFALTQRGLKVILLEAQDTLANKASGNRFGLLMPFITTRDSLPARLYASGFTFTHSLLTGTLSHKRLLYRCGGIQLPSTKRLKRELESNAPLMGHTPIQRVCEREGALVSGLDLQSKSFFVPEGGYVSPRALVNSMIENSGSSKAAATSQRVCSLTRTEHGWCSILSSGDVLTSDYIIVCGAHESSLLEPISLVPLEPIRGQTLIIRQTTDSSRLRTLVCFDGYITPSFEGEHLVGAHYRHHDLREHPCSNDTDEVLRRCQITLTTTSFKRSDVVSARACFRTSTLDRIPYIGTLPDLQQMREEARALRSGSDIQEKVGLRSIPGLFISAGHGSRGLLSCPIGGEIIARLILKEPLGEFAEAAAICDPARIAYRVITATPTNA